MARDIKMDEDQFCSSPYSIGKLQFSRLVDIGRGMLAMIWWLKFDRRNFHQVAAEGAFPVPNTGMKTFHDHLFFFEQFLYLHQPQSTKEIPSMIIFSSLNSSSISINPKAQKKFFAQAL
ncbi:unnamed protein product [Vicia faba]|uniref:Uncharacterized protein n=1 Tax=Vicia faba TaxID=3906 RepID=A0AAV0ZXE5_VICFA|nr:unnamed protein product [Vicia faba]